ncbi:heparinase II/III family protein [Coraliomargarita algicola]|uniref:Heparinase II/III family protein n=1 Tax=Coraliomargarita algicola TaxID=3092156 RepID=A0ABZ0RNV7_9BACT|nr:carbohydrate binding domain-containing protein [Coraliomargarita sp. J2-16]WPJ97098.1 heparinase II/III family protein [Coraliomargarita sp. J2-16]
MKVIILSLLVGISTFACANDNSMPMPNADFESGDTGWSFNGSMSSIQAHAARSGSYGLEVNDTKHNLGSNLRSWKQSVMPGQSYQLDFDARILSGDGIAVYLQFYNAQDQLIRDSQNKEQILRTIPGEASDWERFSLAATAPETASSLRVWIHSFISSEVLAQFDNFTLRPVSQEAVQRHGSEQAADRKVSAYSWIGNPDNLIVFAKDSPATAFAELKVMQADGSPYRSPKEDWEQARSRVENNPQWSDWLEEKRAEIDAWILEKQDRVGWEAGWNHEFISPKDGAFLIWTKDVPGEDVDYLMSKTGDRVEVTPTLIRAWVGAFRKRHADMMIEAAYLYRLTEDPAYAEWVAEQLDFYANNYDSWGNGASQKQHSHLGFQSLDDAVIISRQIDATRLIFDYATPERRQAWFTKLFKPEAALLDSCFQTIHNIATWQRATQAKIALLYEDAELWQQAIEGTFGLKAQFQRGVTSDYIWYEQSMGYNGFIIMGTHSLFSFSALLGEKDKLAEEAYVAQNLMLAPLALRFPNGHLPNPSDNTGNPKASTTWLAKTYRIFPTYLGLEAARSSYNWDTLIDPPAQIVADDSDITPAYPVVHTRNMESSQFALLKEGPWQVFFHFGQLNRSHSQAEALNWSASYKGLMLSEDVGTVGYGSPLASNYYRKGLAHNIPLIKGQGQKPWSTGELIEFDADQARVAARQNQYRQDVSAERSLQIDGDTLIDQVSIQLKDGSAASPLGLSLHIIGQAQLNQAFRSIESEQFSQDRPRAFQYWSDIKATEYEGSANIPVQLSNGDLIEIEFEHEGPFTLYVATAPGRPNTSHTGFYLETPPLTKANWTTYIRPIIVSNDSIQASSAD